MNRTLLLAVLLAVLLTGCGGKDGGSMLAIAFGGASVHNGGVQSGSVRKVSGGGNLDAVQPCGIAFGNYPTSPGSFRASFTVTTTGASACQ